MNKKIHYVKNHCSYFKHNLGIEIQTAHQQKVAGSLDIHFHGNYKKKERAKKWNITEIDDKKQKKSD